MKNFKTDQITVEDGIMTKLNDAQLEQVSGGSNRMTRVPQHGPQGNSSDGDRWTYDYGNMQFVP